MTKEKAVSLLSQMFCIQFSKEEHEALAMAIDALNADRNTEPQMHCKGCRHYIDGMVDSAVCNDCKRSYTDYYEEEEFEEPNYYDPALWE